MKNTGGTFSLEGIYPSDPDRVKRYAIAKEIVITPISNDFFMRPSPWEGRFL